MKKGTCAICKAQGVVSDPRSEPPYVHLSCVLKASGPQTVAGWVPHNAQGKIFNSPTGRDSRARPHDRCTTRERLHPAVFRPDWKGEPPQEGSIAEAHPASRPKEAAS